MKIMLESDLGGLRLVLDCTTGLSRTAHGPESHGGPHSMGLDGSTRDSASSLDPTMRSKRLRTERYPGLSG